MRKLTSTWAAHDRFPTVVVAGAAVEAETLAGRGAEAARRRKHKAGK
jgi:hypothetical protein